MCSPEYMFDKVVSATIKISNIIRQSNLNETEKNEIEAALSQIENSLHVYCYGNKSRIIYQE